MKSGFVYIIQRVEKDEFYIGSATDVEKRLNQHNAGNVTATKYKRPYKLAFCQKFESLDEAKRIERKIKNWKRKDWIIKIIKDGRIKFLDD
ncbi:MAG: GIY-YIG nuclease family protein [Candidatus Berkelbacteria bacterium]|nr:GIY-YIG nuclease family protein [Candidatus Berkelbacteria bacterium]